MNAPLMRQGAALIFAVNESAAHVAAALIKLIGQDAGCSECMQVSGPGEAMRLIYRYEPPLIFICVGIEGLDDIEQLIETLRSRRPQLPQLTVAAEHDQEIERAIRSAGATYYFALDSRADIELLRQTLQSLNTGSDAAFDHAGRPPPRSRGAPAGRITKT